MGTALGTDPILVTPPHPFLQPPELLVLATAAANCGVIYVRRERDIDAACHPSIGLMSLRHR